MIAQSKKWLSTWVALIVGATAVLGCGVASDEAKSSSSLTTTGTAQPQASSALVAATPAQSVVNALSPNLVIKRVTPGAGWIWVKAQYNDEAIPLVVDILASTNRPPTKLLYLLPGTALNFEGNFFTPPDKNLAHFMRGNGYLVICINPREDGLAPTANDASVAGWGLAKRKQDVRKVIAAIGRVLPLPYDLLGHSSGALHALDYASTFDDRLRKLMLIDITGPYDPVSEPDYVAMSAASYDAYVQLLQAGSYTLDGFNAIKELLAGAAAYPQADSGVERPVGGNFTLEGLAYFSSIYTGLLPGPTTPITGLPEEWYYVQGLAAGTYNFATDPLQDTYSLSQSPLSVISAAAFSVGSGLNTTAHLRDLVAVQAGSSSYPLAWNQINEKVTWINTQLGMGDHPYAANLIRAGGNSRVRFSVVPNYAHADPVFGTNADLDFWPLLLQ